MKKVLSLIIMILIMMVVLTGCVQVDYNIKINEDKSADIVYICGFDNEYLTKNSINANDATSAMQNTAVEDDFTIEEYSDDKISGFKATKHVEDVSKISLKETFGENYVIENEGENIKIETVMGKTIYSQDAKIDLSEMSSMETFVKIKYSITLPTSAGDNNANEVSKDGKTLTWNLTAGEVVPVYFKAVKTEIGLLIVEILAFIIVAGGIAFGTIKIVKKYKNNNKVISKKIKNGKKATTEIFKEKEPIVKKKIKKNSKEK